MIAIKDFGMPSCCDRCNMFDGEDCCITLTRCEDEMSYRNDDCPLVELDSHIGECDRCGGEIYPNTLCIECNDYLAKSVFAEEIKQEIEKEMSNADTNDYLNGLNMALMIINEKHIGKEQE